MPPGVVFIVTSLQIWRIFSFFDEIRVQLFGVTFVIAPGEEVPAGDKQRGNQRPNDKAVNAVQFHTAEGGDQNQVVRHFGVFPHQQRAQDVVHQPDDDHKEADNKQPLPDLMRGEQEDGGGHPDNRRADGGHQGEERHQRAPEHAAVNTHNCKRNSAEYALNHGHRRRSFYRGARDANEFSEQVLLGEIRQGQGVEDLAHQIRAVFQQEEQQIKHDAEANRKAKRPFTNQKRAAGEILPALQGDIGEFFLDLRGVGQVVIRQEAAGPAWKMVEDARHHFRELGVVLLQFGVNHVQLNGERGEDHHQRDKDDQADNADGQQRGKPVAFPQRGAQLVFNRVKNDGQNRGPQYRGEVGREHVEEGPGHKGENENKEAFGQSVKAHQSVLVTKKL